jgi:hypothetical protein
MRYRFGLDIGALIPSALVSRCAMIPWNDEDETIPSIPIFRVPLLWSDVLDFSSKLDYT